MATGPPPRLNRITTYCQLSEQLQHIHRLKDQTHQIKLTRYSHLQMKPLFLKTSLNRRNLLALCPKMMLCAQVTRQTLDSQLVRAIPRSRPMGSLSSLRRRRRSTVTRHTKHLRSLSSSSNCIKTKPARACCTTASTQAPTSSSININVSPCTRATHSPTQSSRPRLRATQLAPSSDPVRTSSLPTVAASTRVKSAWHSPSCSSTYSSSKSTNASRIRKIII